MAASIGKRCFVFFVVLIYFSAFIGVKSHGHSHQDHGHEHDGPSGHSHDDHGHAHDHEHEDEHDEHTAHFKYSKEANAPEDGIAGIPGAKKDLPIAPPKRDHAKRPGLGSFEHSHDQEEDLSTSQRSFLIKSKTTGIWLWMSALGSTALVSVAPVFILLFIPLDNTAKHQPLLKVLLSFASGGLLGDAFLHLIPHAISPHSHSEDGGHEHSHSHSHTQEQHHGHSHGEDHSHNMAVGLWVLAGIIAFLIVEKFVRYVKGGHGHSHGHTENDKKPEVAAAREGKKDGLRKRKTSDSDSKEEKSEKTGDEVHTEGEIKVAGYLNLAADFTHNFTDGLAIGASYLAGTNVGIITTITILLHEVPHEVGDFAILVQSGCSKRKAMLLQFSTAAGAMFGTLCSLFAEGIGDAAVAWILPFTAGGFIYIATVSVIPELLEDSKLGQTMKEILAMVTGVMMMVFIAEIE